VTVSRGEAYWIDLPEADDDDQTVTGSEQAEQRPGIVVQNDSENNELNTTIILPTTTGSREEARRYLSMIFISSDKECLTQDSIALCNQLRVVDVDERFLDCIGEISPKKMREIEKGLQVVLDLY